MQTKMAWVLALSLAGTFGCGIRGCHPRDHGHGRGCDGPCEGERDEAPCDSHGGRGGHGANEGRDGHGPHGAVSHAPPPAPEPVVTAPPPTRHLGAMMAEVGERLERSGRAVQAGNWEFAAYDVHELEEVFEDEIAVYSVAEEAPLDIGKVAAGFARAQLPVLARAIEARDLAAFERAYAQTAEGCTSCHRAADHGFIVIPTTLGEPVPRLTPEASSVPTAPPPPTPTPPPSMSPRRPAP